MRWLLEGALPFLVVLGTVVVFHEFGHFLAAKAFGITVEIFSVGFGPKIAGFNYRGTEYRVAWIPLGGYVKLKGETGAEDGRPPEPGDLMAHPRWQRFIVFVMGAVFNLITAVGLTTVILMMGVQEYAYLKEAPVVGHINEEGPAVAAGIEPGDLILSFGGVEVPTWKDLQIEMMLSPRQTKEIVLERDGKRVVTQLAIEADARDIGRPGLYPLTDGVAVGSLQEGWPAEEAGLRQGDRLVAIDGMPMPTVNRLVQTIQASPGKPLVFSVEREGEALDLTIVPRDDGGLGRTGFAPVPLMPTVTRTFPFFAAVQQSIRQNAENVGLIFTTFKKLIRRELSFKAFSGPVDLVRFSGQAAHEGLIPFLGLMAFVSLNLGIINLFPIPPLDGGHLFTITIEGVIRRELSVQLKERVMQAGLILLLLFMGTIIYFDISKNFFN
jgi:regulator of sigma E protease